MRLYHSPTTPFGRKVMVALIETGQADDVTIINAAGTPLDSGSLPIAQNPLGKIPALELDDGPALYDSRVICRFIDDRAGGKLYPKAPALWQVLTLEATADGMLDAAILMVYEARVRPEDKQFEGWVEGQWAKVSRALDALENRWIAHLNAPLDMAHIAVGCTLSYLDFRHEARNWRQNRPALAAWYDEFSKRESMTSTEPKG